ncbi:MAG: hypothetical protein MUC83_19905 [Pirellula sp.]|nr:hypothetical protein [Pirellula sp.]
MVKRIIGIFAAIVVVVVLMLVRPMLRNADSFSRADSLAAKGDYNGAFYAYGDVIRRNPQDPLAFWSRLPFACPRLRESTVDGESDSRRSSSRSTSGPNGHHNGVRDQGSLRFFKVVNALE